jgi:hypothetical protein
VAYTLPTPTDLKTRFPEFTDVADEDITPFINAASIWVDTYEWTETDYFYAIMYLAAHYIAMWQRAEFAATTGGSAGGDTGSSVTTYVSSIKFEDFQVSFGKGGSSSSSTGGGGGTATNASEVLAMSPYGMLFVELRDRNIVPFALLAGPTL